MERTVDFFMQECKELTQSQVARVLNGFCHMTNWQGVGKKTMAQDWADGHRSLKDISPAQLKSAFATFFIDLKNHQESMYRNQCEKDVVEFSESVRGVEIPLSADMRQGMIVKAILASVGQRDIEVTEAPSSKERGPFVVLVHSQIVSETIRLEFRFLRNGQISVKGSYGDHTLPLRKIWYYDCIEGFLKVWREYTRYMLSDSDFEERKREMARRFMDSMRVICDCDIFYPVGVTLEGMGFNPDENSVHVRANTNSVDYDSDDGFKFDAVFVVDNSGYPKACRSLDVRNIGSQMLAADEDLIGDIVSILRRCLDRLR